MHRSSHCLKKEWANNTSNPNLRVDIYNIHMLSWQKTSGVKQKNADIIIFTSVTVIIFYKFMGAQYKCIKYIVVIYFRLILFWRDYKKIESEKSNGQTLNPETLLHKLVCWSYLLHKSVWVIRRYSYKMREQKRYYTSRGQSCISQYLWIAISNIEHRWAPCKAKRHWSVDAHCCCNSRNRKLHLLL